jgi:crotonobetainyl-CoA:carnitine CoA-transferase CaiB-like acyl-CoA transferase
MRPLDGITVVSLEQAVAAPLATRHLADLGARVIKVERPDGGDFARAYDGAVRGMAAHFVWLNRGKESVTLDLKSEAGREALAGLVEHADVFLQNLAPGAAARLGFDAASLRARHPELIVVDMSGYGSAGPYRDKLAYDLLVQGETAVASVTGTADTPVKTGIPIADIGAGMYAYSSTLAALLRRERGGAGDSGDGGAHLEISMFDAVAEWMGHPLYTAMHTGRELPRSGLGHPVIAPYDAYPTADRQPDGSAARILIGIQNDRQWQRLAETVLGRPELAHHPEFGTNVARAANREAVDAAVAETTRTLGADELLDRLDKAGIGNARLNPVSGLAEHPQLTARDRWREVDTPVGPISALLPPMNFADADPETEGPVMGPVPALGEHTDAVLAEFGLGDAGRQRQ